METIRNSSAILTLRDPSLLFKRICVKREKRNFLMPSEISGLFDVLSAPYRSKEKWITMTAALLAYVELPEGRRLQLMKDVASASVLGDSFADLIDSAAQTAGEREAAEASAGREQWGRSVTIAICKFVQELREKSRDLASNASSDSTDVAGRIEPVVSDPRIKRGTDPTAFGQLRGAASRSPAADDAVRRKKGK